MNNDLQAGVIYVTKDYDKFIIDENYNRDVDEKHVKDVMKSIGMFGDHGICFPIVVDNNFKVTDGQHRFTARAKLGLPIYYIMNIALDSKVLGGINKAMKKWKKEDFMNAAKDTEVAKEINIIKNVINWNQLSYAVLLKALSVNINNTLSSDIKLQEAQLRKVQRIKPLFIFYMRELLEKVTDIDTFNFTGNTYSRPLLICMLAKKLARFGVNKEDIPKGEYSEVLAHLYGNQLIK